MASESLWLAILWLVSPYQQKLGAPAGVPEPATLQQVQAGYSPVDRKVWRLANGKIPCGGAGRPMVRQICSIVRGSVLTQLAKSCEEACGQGRLTWPGRLGLETASFSSGRGVYG